MDFSSISIPAISSGIFGFPKDKCAQVLFDVSLNFFEENPKGSLQEIRLVNYDDKTVEIFENEFITRFGKKKDELSEEDMIKLVMQESMQETQGKEEKSILKKEFKSNDYKIELRIGDITLEDTDCIVNAANGRLDHSAGVAGAIIKRGGDSIQDECFKFININGPLKESECFVSGSGKLSCKKIVHSIGPIWSDGKSNEDALLVLTILNSLDAASKNKLKSITFPAVSTGKFGFPKELCASLIFEASEYYFTMNPDTCVKEVRLTVFDDDTLNVFEKSFDSKFKDHKELKNFDDLFNRVEKMRKH